jgi:hypothetical protein
VGFVSDTKREFGEIRASGEEIHHLEARNRTSFGERAYESFVDILLGKNLRHSAAHITAEGTHRLG